MTVGKDEVREGRHRLIGCPRKIFCLEVNDVCVNADSHETQGDQVPDEHGKMTKFGVRQWVDGRFGVIVARQDTRSWP